MLGMLKLGCAELRLVILTAESFEEKRYAEFEDRRGFFAI